jgi:endoglucanase
VSLFRNVTTSSALRRAGTRMLVGATALALAGLAAAQVGQSRSSAAAANPALHVVGNHLVNSTGSTVQLVGVDRSGTEYACIQGWGIFDGPSDASSVATIASWHANAVRVPLNEDCWLGINGAPSAYSGATYRNAIAAYVQELNAAGMVAILDLHWGAPGTTKATSQEQMPDAAHAPAFWTSVAGTFAHTPGVMFDLFNEPHDVSWSCWRNGCTLPNGTVAVGMQTLLSAVRAAGATQPVLAEGLNWGGDLSGWLANAPVDPDHALVASAHLYNFSGCNSATCWSSTIAPVAASVPVVTGEIGETDCSASWINSYMTWADSHGISYLAWAWDAGGGWSCSSGPGLFNSYDGTPNVYGTGYRSHLAALATTTPVTTTTTPATTTTTTTVPVTTTVAPAKPVITYTSTITQSWGTGATVDLHITNRGTTALGTAAHPWSVSFALPASTTVTSLWDATLVSQSGGMVKAVVPSYAPALAPGASIDIDWAEQGGASLPASVTVSA